MTDIKTREVNKGYIKTIDHVASMDEHMRSVAIRTREQAGHDGSDDTSDASSYASDDMVYAAKDAETASTRAAKGAFDGIRSTENESNAHIDLKTRVDMVKRSEDSSLESEKVEKSRIRSNKVEKGREVSKKVDNGRERSNEVGFGRERSKKVELFPWLSQIKR